MTSKWPKQPKVVATWFCLCCFKTTGPGRHYCGSYCKQHHRDVCMPIIQRARAAMIIEVMA